MPAAMPLGCVRSARSTGIAALDAARNITEVNRAAAQLTWNENLMAADDHGNIGYWHPGTPPDRPQELG